MTHDLNEEVEILGKIFRFQTRLADPAVLLVRTEVWLDDKVVATREASFDREPRDEEIARAWMQEHHRRVFEMFIARALRYQGREPPGTETLPVPQAATGRAKRRWRASAAPPSAEASEELANALRVRRFFGGFSKLIGSASNLDPHEIAQRLEKAAEALAWMIQSPLFAQIRVDEQVRCHLLSGQIDSWSAGRRGPGQARRIWSGILTFRNYLAEVNHRGVLVAFDQQMLAWALARVERRGMSDEVLEQLTWLYGLLPQLNRLIEHPEEVDDDAWIARLRLALTLTEPYAVDAAEDDEGAEGR